MRLGLAQLRGSFFVVPQDDRVVRQLLTTVLTGQRIVGGYLEG